MLTLVRDSMETNIDCTSHTQARVDIRNAFGATAAETALQHGHTVSFVPRGSTTFADFCDLILLVCCGVDD